MLVLIFSCYEACCVIHWPPDVNVKTIGWVGYHPYDIFYFQRFLFTVSIRIDVRRTPY